jgi:hypothetical protein
MAAESLAGIDPERIASALVEAGGHIGKAARALGVKAAALRRLVTLEPDIMDAALEAVELALDESEATLLDGMRTGPLANRLQAAAFIARGRR